MERLSCCSDISLFNNSLNIWICKEKKIFGKQLWFAFTFPGSPFYGINIIGRSYSKEKLKKEVENWVTTELKNIIGEL